MSEYQLLSNRVLRVLGATMALVGLVDGVIELRLSAYGFAPFACVLAVYYLHHSRTSLCTSPTGKSDTRIYKRCTLLLFGVSVIELCLLEIASRVSPFDSMEALGYVGGLVLLITFCLATSCFMVVLLRYIRGKLSGW